MGKEILKKNWMFILFVLIGICCLIIMDTNLPMSIVPYPDSQIEISVNDDVLEQTWLSEVKEISGVSFVAVPNCNFDAEMQMDILDGNTRETLTTSLQKVSLEEGETKEISFSFPTLKDCQGEQYIFQLSGVSDLTDAKLVISSGTNYMGCTLNGIEQQQGADFCVIFTKTNLLSWLFISFLPFIAFSLLFMTLWNKKWEECIGLATAVLIFVLYVMGLFGSLETGMIIVYILSILAFAVGVILYNKKNMQLSDLNSYGLIIYGIIILLILFNCRDARFARWDEFSHWGLAAKDMYYSDSFAKHIDSTVIVKHYPPITTIIEYFFCYTNRLFSENSVYVGFQVLILNLLSAGMGICKNRKPAIVIPVFFSLLFIPIIIFNDVYNCLYADSMLAFGIAYVLICYYVDNMDKFNFLRILGGLFIVTLTKYTGVVLAGLLGMIMLGDIIYKQYREKKWNIRKIGVNASFVVWVCMLFFVWQFYLSRPIENETDNITNSVKVSSETVSNVEAGKKEDAVVDAVTVNSGITLEKLVELGMGTAPSYRYKAIENFFANLFSDNKYSLGLITIPYMDLTILILLFSLLISGKCAEKKDKDEIQAFGILTFIANIGYCGFILVTYLFSFTEQEALMSSSYGRYLGSYLCGVIVAFSVILIKKVENWDEKLKRAILLIMTAILIVITPVEFFWVKNEDTTLPDNFVYGYEEVVNILQTGAQKGDRVYFVCNDSNGFAELQFKTAAVPMITTYPGSNMYSSEESYEKQVNLYGARKSNTPYFVSFEKWEKRLCNYQYVVLFHPNEVFSESYGSLFEDSESISDGAIYKVYQENGNIKLRLVGKTGILEFF